MPSVISQSKLNQEWSERGSRDTQGKAAGVGVIEPGREIMKAGILSCRAKSRHLSLSIFGEPIPESDPPTDGLAAANL
jgi:hypothetical protein